MKTETAESELLHESASKLAHIRAEIAKAARRLVEGDMGVVQELTAYLAAETLAKAQFNVMVKQFHRAV